MKKKKKTGWPLPAEAGKKEEAKAEGRLTRVARQKKPAAWNAKAGVFEMKKGSMKLYAGDLGALHCRVSRPKTTSLTRSSDR